MYSPKLSPYHFNRLDVPRLVTTILSAFVRKSNINVDSEGIEGQLVVI